MCIKTEMLCNGKNQEMFTKTFPLSARGLADTNGRATMAGDAVNQTRGQTSEGIFDGKNMATSTATWALTWISTCACCSLLFRRVN